MNLAKRLLVFFIVWQFTSCSDNINHNRSNKVSLETEESGDDDEGCGFDDGLHSATVEYYNPNTDHNATYTLDVEVENCEVTVIHFPNGGWLDSDHITPDELDEDGFVSIEGEEGKTYDVQID